MKINAHTQLYCIFGNPVRHSLSPIIHNVAFQKLNINATYLAFEPPTLQQAWQAIKTLDIKGVSLTIPYKIKALSLADDLDDLAEKIGSLNTLHNIKGKIKGYNTDGWGAFLALQENKVKIKGRSVLIIGNGGSARAIAFTLLTEGAKIHLAGRNLRKVEGLTQDLIKINNQATPLLLKDLDEKYMQGIDIIINTTPLGMNPKPNISPLPKKILHNHHLVFDIVYAPEETLLLKDALARKAKIIKGKEMLIYQAIKQLEIWTGHTIEKDIILKALNK